jgi:hypothetical protein
MRLHLAPALVVPEHCTLPVEERLPVEELPLLSVLFKAGAACAAGAGVAAVPEAKAGGLHTLQGVRPSACALLTVVSKELFR